MNPLTLVIDCLPNEGNKDQAISTLKALGPKIKAEEGCLTFDILVSEDKNSYMIYETWSSEALWQAHLQSDHMKDFSPFIHKLFKVFDVKRYGHVNE